MELECSIISIDRKKRAVWLRSLRPLHLKQLVFQALMKRIPQEMLESFLFEKSNYINNLQNQDTSKTPIESHPHEKCDANCDARVQKSAPHLWLRNNIFYCRIELPRVDGKRRYKRFSLHTNNYYEAKTLIDQQQYIEHTVLNVHKLFDKMLLKAWPDCSDF